MPKPNPIVNRAVVTDTVCDVMHEKFRDDSIDALLTRPFEAIGMALDVLKKSGRINGTKANRIARNLVGILTADADAEKLINDVLRVALSSRKRGELRKDRY
jgi:hypothetical protein